MKTKTRPARPRSSLTTRRRPPLRLPVLTVDEAFEIMNQAAYDRFRYDLVEWLRSRRFSKRKAELLDWAGSCRLRELARHPVSRRFMRELLTRRAGAR